MITETFLEILRFFNVIFRTSGRNYGRIENIAEKLRRYREIVLG